LLISIERSTDSLFGTKMGYGKKWWGSVPGRCKEFSFFHNAKTESEAHPISYTVDTGDYFPRGEAALV
jgi:hypothetical protein